jgi:hypothetical protein
VISSRQESVFSWTSIFFNGLEACTKASDIATWVKVKGNYFWCTYGPYGWNSHTWEKICNTNAKEIKETADLTKLEDNTQTIVKETQRLLDEKGHTQVMMWLMRIGFLLFVLFVVWVAIYHFCAFLRYLCGKTPEFLRGWFRACKNPKDLLRFRTKTEDKKNGTVTHRYKEMDITPDNQSQHSWMGVSLAFLIELINDLGVPACTLCASERLCSCECPKCEQLVSCKKCAEEMVNYANLANRCPQCNKELQQDLAEYSSNDTEVQILRTPTVPDMFFFAPYVKRAYAAAAQKGQIGKVLVIIGWGMVMYVTYYLGYYTWTFKPMKFGCVMVWETLPNAVYHTFC